MFENALIVPFFVVVMLCIYLIYTRNRFENEVYCVYDAKFEEWKQSSNNITKETTPVEKVCGIIYEHEDVYILEFFDEIPTKQFQTKIRKRA